MSDNKKYFLNIGRIPKYGKKTEYVLVGVPDKWQGFDDNPDNLTPETRLKFLDDVEREGILLKTEDKNLMKFHLDLLNLRIDLHDSTDDIDRFRKNWGESGCHQKTMDLKPKRKV